MIDESVIRACTEGSFSGTMVFPEVVARLSAIGVGRYHTDLARLEKTYYTDGGESVREALPLDASPPVADAFSEERVREALRAIQQQEIDYPEFLRRIMTAGTVSYEVYLRGRRTLYFGKDGVFYVERFPGAT